MRNFLSVNMTKSKANLDNQIPTYRIREIPDWSCWQSQAVAGGDVRQAVFSSCESLARQIAHMVPGSVVAEILFVFDPKCKDRDMQSRLQPYLRIQTSDDSMSKAMCMLIERGEISRFYKLERIHEPLDSRGSLAASCDIIRRQDFIKPQHSCDFNPKIPDQYRTISQLKANKENDFRTLDRVLDRVDERVVISVRIAPADISSERQALTALMERYHSVNRSRDFDGDDYAGIDYLGGDDYKYHNHHSKLSPLNLKDPIADDAWRSLQPIHRSMCHQPYLFFSVRIRAETEGTARVVGGVVAEADFEGGNYRLIVSKKGYTLFDETVEVGQQYEITPLPVYKYFTDEREGRNCKQLDRLIQLATVDELAGAFRLPVASSFSPVLCLRKNTDPVYEDPKDLIVIGYNEQGIEGNSNPIPVGLRLDEICKHVALFGVSGSGKTTININILYQLYNKKIPFIVIETSKTELRVIKRFRKHKNPCFRKLAEDLQVFTLGNEGCSPLRSNPLEVPPGIERDSHIVRQRELFSALMPMFPALPGILGEGMIRSYERNPDPNSAPVIAELYSDCLDVSSEKDYSEEVSSNIRGALDVRLGDLTRLVAGNVFKCRKSIPSIPHLMSTYSVIELDRLSPDQKCQETLSFLNSLSEHVQPLPPADGLRLVVIVEECHNIFSQTGEARPSEEVPNPMAYVVANMNRLLVEFRAKGVGIVLADQYPSKLDPSAVMGTCTKVAGREIHGDDRDVLAVSMLLPEFQAEDLARMKVGEAYFFKEGYYRPIRIKTENLHKQLDLRKFPTDQELLENIRNDKWFRKMAAMRISTELYQLKEYMDKFDDQRQTIANRVKNLLGVYNLLLNQKQDRLKKQRLSAIVRRLRVLKRKLVSSHSQFKKGPYRMFSYLITDEIDCQQDDLRTLAKSLNRRFESVIESGTRGLLVVMERLVRNCKLKFKEANHVEQKKK